MKESVIGIVSGITLAILLGVPVQTHAAGASFFGPIVPAACHCDNQAVVGASSGAPAVTSAPDYGCVLQIIQNVINLAISLSVILFTIYLVITGFSFITSAGNSEARSKAKTRFTNVFVGLVVILCAWLLVDFVMKTIYNEKGFFGPWNSILAGDGKDHCITPNQPKAITSGSVVSNIETVAPGTSAPTSSTGGYTGGGFTYQSGVQRQIPMESAALSNLLSCMATKVPAGVGNISAITENAIADGTKTMQQCNAGGCAHTANSCHYGGRNCTGLSYAVDFGDQGNATALRNAARTCDPKARWNYEGNHVHISVGPEAGCSCDSGLGAI